MSKSNAVGFWLDVIPGLLGLFGFGQIYLGMRHRGQLFLVWTAALYVCLLLSFAYPALSYYWSYLPIGWATGYFVLIVDILRITKRNKQLAVP